MKDKDEIIKQVGIWINQAHEKGEAGGAIELWQFAKENSWTVDDDRSAVGPIEQVEVVVLKELEDYLIKRGWLKTKI